LQMNMRMRMGLLPSPMHMQMQMQQGLKLTLMGPQMLRWTHPMVQLETNCSKVLVVTKASPRLSR